MNRHLCSALVALAGLLVVSGCLPGTGSITEGQSQATAQPATEASAPAPAPGDHDAARSAAALVSTARSEPYDRGAAEEPRVHRARDRGLAETVLGTQRK